MRSPLRAGITVFFLTTMIFAADYFPLAVGNVWTYSVPGFGAEGSLRMEIDQQSSVGGDTFFRMQVKFFIPGMADSMTGYMISSGNDVFSAESLTEMPPYLKAFEHQPVVGHVWDYDEGGTAKIVFYGTYTVTAGTYNDCYAIVDGADTVEIYAPDVGMIAVMTDGVIEFELTSFNGSSAAVRFNPGALAGKPSSPAAGVYSDLFSVVNVMGRRVDKAAAGGSLRTLSPGTYVAIDKRANPSKRARKWCVTGR